MNDPSQYPIGTPGIPWQQAEKRQWFEAQTIQREYRSEVLDKLSDLGKTFALEQYGALSHNPDRYPLMLARSSDWSPSKPIALVTGGVHGYETSGVQGAIRFMQTAASDISDQFNLLVAPCVSPWGYETINRWNPAALDPNRSFFPDSPCEEAAALMAWLKDLDMDFEVHMDLHETTDTDNSEFRPALSARDGIQRKTWHIPDGFYTVGDTQKPTPGFQNAIIDSVAQVTHIAPTDAEGTIIGAVPDARGVISYDVAELGLCMGVTSARFVTTTEVYPDSPKADDEICIRAQVAAVEGGLAYVRNNAKGPF